MIKKFYFKSILVIYILTVFDLNAKDISLSLNYFYIGAKERYAFFIPKSLDNQGIGIQGNFHLKNSFYLLADAGCYFDSYYKDNTSPDDFVESYLSCYAANANLAYRLGNAKFLVLPYLGFGLFDEYSRQRFKGTHPPENFPPPYDAADKYHSLSIMGNIGFSVEYFVTDKIFITGGIKYMVDLYDFKYNAFPCLNGGIGYKL